MKNTELYTKMVAEAYPHIYKSCMPRRFIPPQGYANPKMYAASLTGCALMWRNPKLNLMPHTTCCLVAAAQVIKTVPTYFVQNEFAQAVANTKLPADFKLSEIKWPLDALLFVLPDSFVRSYFKFDVPFLSVCRMLAGQYPNVEQRNHARLQDWELPKFTPIFNQVDRMLIHFPCFFSDEFPCDYSGNWPLNLDLTTVKAADFVDATLYECSLSNVPVPTPTGAPTPEQEKELQDKMTTFAVKLLLAFNARPHLLKTGNLARPAKFKHGKQVKDELWNPNMLGGEYRAARSNNGSLGGTHASPRMHWRPGHFTHQFVGKRGDPNFVSAADLPRSAKDGTVEWDKLSLEAQALFWKNHQLRWLEPVLVDVSVEKST